MLRSIHTRFSFLVKRLPVIALYSFALIAIFSMGQYVFYKHIVPDNYYVRNYTMTVFNTTEHSDVQVRVCRDRRGSYVADGVRTIYIVPKDQPESSKVIAGRYTLKDVSIDGERCDLFFIKVTDFDHKAGDYIAYTNLSFTAKYGRQISVEFPSNKYTIGKASSSDLEQRIKDLQEQLELLKKLRDEQAGIVSTSQPEEETQIATTSEPPKNPSSSSNPSTPSTPTPVNPTPIAPTPQQNGLVEGTIKNVDDLLNQLLGL